MERQPQLTQGDFGGGSEESSEFLKERIEQLEADIESLKEKHKKELDLLVKSAMDSSTGATAAAAAGASNANSGASAKKTPFHLPLHLQTLNLKVK